jgi:antitoxin component YwqK of YwqJK toxin-antitoxin module
MRVNRVLAALALSSLFAGCEQSVQTTAPVPTPEPEGPQSPAIEVKELYWDDGSIRMRAEVIAGTDSPVIYHGHYTRWHKTGNKEYEAVFVEGKVHGLERQWHPNGQLRVEQHFDHGVPHGTRVSWDPKGKKRKQEEYHRGKPHGTWSVWTADGRIKWQQAYVHGVPQP